MTHDEKVNSSRSAKALYQPIGLVGSILAGVIAGQIVEQVWKRVASGDRDEPKPLESEYSMTEVLAAAAVHGLVYGVVKAFVRRGGARGFERLTGEWPGD